MTKLNQIIAIEKDTKAQGESTLTLAYHTLQKTPLLSGISRTYQPKDDEGDRLPPESTRVQVRTDEVIRNLVGRLTRMYDVVATKETTNTTARANVVVDGEVLLSDVPVTVLIFLEKQLVDLTTFIRKLPVLDAAETWHYDEASNSYATDSVQTTRTKKVPRNHVKAPATDRHPAQVEMWFEDVVVGHWTTVRFSGAVTDKRVAELVERAEKLRVAVKTAREEANVTEVIDSKVGERFLGYLFD